MSTGGFIAQALLGGAGNAAKGIGDRLREDARLKREQALVKTRAEKEKEVNTHQSALRIGENNLQNEFASNEAEEERAFRSEEADRRFEQQKELVDYKLTSELKLARQKASESGSLTDAQDAYLKRINGDIDHLQQMERELSTGRTGEFGEIGIVTPDNSGEKIKEIRQRIKAREIAFNRILGGTKGTDPSLPILNQAATITDPNERNEFLADLKQSAVYSDDLASAVQEVWGAESQPTQQAQPEPQPDPAPNPEPGGGMMTEAGAGSEPAQPQTGQPATQQAPPAVPQTTADVDMSPNNNSAQTLQQQIIERSREEGRANYKKAAEQAQQEVENLIMYGTLDKMPAGGQSRREFFNKYGKYIPAMSPEVIERIKAVLGDDAVNQYLN